MIMHIFIHTTAGTLLLVISYTPAKTWSIQKQIIHSYIQTVQLNYDIQNGKINILMLIGRTIGTTEYIFGYNTLLNTHTCNLRI